jgi:hypothetical protein
MIPTQIKQIIAPTGDWFQLQIESLPEGEDRIVMSRICAWAVMSGGNEWVEAVDTDGYGRDEHFVYFSVHGDDLAPNGKTWRIVFNETPAFNWGLKDVTAVARPA